MGEHKRKHNIILEMTFIPDNLVKIVRLGYSLGGLRFVAKMAGNYRGGQGV